LKNEEPLRQQFKKIVFTTYSNQHQANGNSVPSPVNKNNTIGTSDVCQVVGAEFEVEINALQMLMQDRITQLTIDQGI